MSELAERLVKVARDAVGANCVAEWDAPDGLVVEIYEADAAKGVASAVLRELAVRGSTSIQPGWVLDLADEIEERQ